MDPDPAYSTSTENSLETFRQEWKTELLCSQNPRNTREGLELESTAANNHESAVDLENAEDKAATMYLQGVKHEQNGEMLEAIRHYKRAMQLVPNIEELIYSARRQETLSTQKIDTMTLKLSKVALAGDMNDNEGEMENECNSSYLLGKLKRIVQQDRRICIPLEETKMTHISSLPMEIIVVLLKWIISVELDLNSLEKMASVCRGFYVCCRDEELWKLACFKVWKCRCGDYESNGYLNWREMYILRPRLHLNGCYISKTSYARPGENSFQDANYKPWHLVNYFRYLRFFSCGAALMLTTADNPLNVVGLLKSKNNAMKNKTLVSGTYLLQGNTVTAVFKRKAMEVASSVPNSRFKRKKDDNNNSGSTVVEHVFHLELEIISKKNRLNQTLNWLNFSVDTVYRNGMKSTSEFEVQSLIRFPPFWFSAVRSYNTESTNPL